MAHVPEHPSDGQLAAMLGRLTIMELDEVMRCRFKFAEGGGPFYDWYKTKAQNIASIVRWARTAPRENIRLLMEDLEVVLRQKDMTERIRAMNNPLPGTRFIRRDELESLPSFPLIQRAIRFPYHHSRVASPWTRDGYVSVAAIYNLVSWASWKSSSLDPHEKAIATAIKQLPLEELMRLNRGRRMDQAAFFPAGFILPREITRR
jgi:hypothetical protein